MATTYEIIQGIQQAAANAYDGAHDERLAHDGESRSAGLFREEGDVITDSRVMDGFSVKIQADRLHVLYQYECMLKHVHQNGFESEIESKVAGIVKYLKKEYKKLTGESLTLTKDGEADIMVEYISRIRTSVRACSVYKIGGLKGVDGADAGTERSVDSAIKDFLAIGKDKYPGTKKPQNVTRKKD
ncbi:MAG: hypothetical protein CMQ51_05640 [Gammaproteobacteria bacterium]|nr:hypothetical protein [Gammaproteobacteria bacterium]|tara:strand:+ start:2224 stop:2781 length:558 start_codon:yes stop_codon:yes gene_type:complete